jgi:hypothetical protein
VFRETIHATAPWGERVDINASIEEANPNRCEIAINPKMKRQRLRAPDFPARPVSGGSACNVASTADRNPGMDLRR